MAITLAELTSDSSDVDATSVATASITPAANKLILVSIAWTPADGTSSPTLSGNGLTYVAIDGGEYGEVGNDRFIGLWRAMGASPSAGAITIDFGAVNYNSVIWEVAEVTGMDTSGTNGSGAIVQSVENLPAAEATSLTVTLAAFASSDNFAFGAFGYATAESSTPGTGFTSLFNAGVATPQNSIQVEYKQNETAVSHSHASLSTNGGVAVEIKASAALYSGLAWTGVS